MAKPKITEMFLTPNKYSRPQIKLEKVKKIAVHYVGNPNTSALANRNYFENCGKTGARYVSSHYIIGLGGEIIQCIPLDEWSYCTNQANGYSISIECCHPDATGKFTAATEKSLAELCAWLVEKYGLAVDDIIRHYDVTGKQCPLYWSPTKYVTTAAANARFAAFKSRVQYIINCGETASNNDEKMPNVPFRVKVIDLALNIRKAAGVSNAAVGVIRSGGVYTIVEVQQIGTAVWGKLKSGVGWINIGKKYVKKV